MDLGIFGKDLSQKDQHGECKSCFYFCFNDKCLFNFRSKKCFTVKPDNWCDHYMHVSQEEGEKKYE